MRNILELPTTDWNQEPSPEIQSAALQALEQGCVLFMPRLNFPLTVAERPFLSAETVGKSKNVSFDIHTGKLHGSRHEAPQAAPLRAMMQRYAESSRALITRLLPRYPAHMTQARTSFRPVEIAGRTTSWRKDDTRLHVDSFPATPVQGRRLLRVFHNGNPDGRSRSWRIGEPFETVAKRYASALTDPLWGSSQLLHWLHVTKTRRSAYDHFMLQLHDLMKADAAYQTSAEQTAFEFPPGSSWIVFTDQVSHAVMSGQFLFEQTFYLPVDALQDPASSPLRVLERLKGRPLAGT